VRRYAAGRGEGTDTEIEGLDDEYQQIGREQMMMKFTLVQFVLQRDLLILFILVFVKKAMMRSND